jgi:hypothetical protein
MKASRKIGGLIGLAAGLAIGYKLSKDKGEKFDWKDALIWGGSGLLGGGILGMRGLTQVGLAYGGTHLSENLVNRLGPKGAAEKAEA